MEIELAIGVFAVCIGEFAVMGLVSDLALDFKITEPTTANLISAYAGGVVVGPPLMVS